MEGGRAWYWTREELEVLVASGRVQLHPLPPAPTAPAPAPPAETEGGEREPPAAVSSAATATSLPTRKEHFTTLLRSSSSSVFGEWTLEMDEALVRLVNATAAKLSLPAAHHVGREELVGAVQSQVRPYAWYTYMNIQYMCADDDPCISSFTPHRTPKQSNQACGPLHSFLTRHGVAPVLVRFAALLWLNEVRPSLCISIFMEICVCARARPLFPLNCMCMYIWMVV